MKEIRRYNIKIIKKIVLLVFLGTGRIRSGFNLMVLS